VGLSWLEPVTISKIPTLARCHSCNEEFRPRPGNVHSGQGCPKCGRVKAGSKKRVAQDVWDGRARAVGVEWLEPVTTSHRHARARCMKCHHEWPVTPSKIGEGQACPKCGRVKAGLARRVTAREWDLRAEAVGVEWLEPVGTKDKPTLAQCVKCGYQWKPAPNHITGGHGCPDCAGTRRYTVEEWNSFAKLVGLELLNEPRNQRDRAELRCTTCAYEYETHAGGLVAGHGCPACAGNRALTQEEWQARAGERGYEFLETVVNSHTRSKARCLTCHKEFQTTPIHQNGCPSCARYGFDPSLPSILYLLRHSEDGALKIGIAKATVQRSSQSRLRSHGRSGWREIRIWNFQTGVQARAVEQLVLGWWRKELGLPVAHEKGSGFTETVSSDYMTTRRVVRFVNKAVRNLS
jgi:Zn finger protein HypA/HybF involved in hydrogenase expression